MAESNLNRIIKTGDTPSGYVRLDGVPDGESIIANAPIIESGGVNYYPIYYICNMDTLASESFTKTGTGVSTGADAYVFSDEPSTLYVGDTTHTFDVADDYTTSENWKCRYVIAYATEANKNVVTGITVNLYSYRATFEFIGSQYLKLSSASTLFGDSTYSNTNKNLRYIDLSNSSTYNNTISANYFCYGCSAIKSILLPNTLTTVTGSSFLRNCASLESVSSPELATFSSSYGLSFCNELKNISFPKLATINGENFCTQCSTLKTISLPALTTTAGATDFMRNCTLLETVSFPLLTNSYGNFLYGCTALKSISLPELTTVSGTYFCASCTALKSISCPKLTTINGSYFLDSCLSLENFEIPSTVTTITSSGIYTLDYTQFIKLPTDFDISACNFTGSTGYNKSLAWFTHLATQLKDNSGGSVKTMVLGATNIALIPSATATIISNKNWTLS